MTSNDVEIDGVTILCGDARDRLSEIPDGSVHVCVTSPPYWGLRDYKTGTWDGGDPNHEHDVVAARGGRGGSGSNSKQSSFPSDVPAWVCSCGARLVDYQIGREKSPEEYVSALVEVFRESRRVLRDDGILWLNCGDTYCGYHGNSKVPDDEAPSNKPGYYENMRATTVGVSGLKSKDLVCIPWMLAMALRTDGWYLRSAMPWVRRAALPDSAADRPGSCLEYVFMFVKSQRYYFDMEAVRRPPSGISGGAKFGKTSLDGPGSRECTKEDRERYANTGRQWRNSDLWFESVDSPHGLVGVGDELVGLDVNPKSYAGAHFATFPLQLVRSLLKPSISPEGCCGKCGTQHERVVEKTDVVDESHHGSRFDVGKTGERDGGDRTQAGDRFVSRTAGWRAACDCQAATEKCVVLDPFGGSGTVAEVSRELGCRSILIELNPDYVPLIRKRLSQGLLI